MKKQIKNTKTKEKIFLNMTLCSVCAFLLSYIILGHVKLISCSCPPIFVNYTVRHYVGASAQTKFMLALSLTVLVVALMFPKGYRYSKSARIISWVLFCFCACYTSVLLWMTCDSLLIC